MSARRTVAEVFGAEAADELARWAIDVLAGPALPEAHAATTMDAKVSWREIDRGRRLLEGAGIDWRTLANNARNTPAQHRT